VSTRTIGDGRYRVERVLGHGGMATVYLAHDGELSRPVAIKVLAENVAADPELRERFQKEARLAARLSHPNVVTVFDTGRDDGPFIVMEYVDGSTVADEVKRRGRLEPSEVVDIGLQACAALEHAHGAGLVHRDVKPGNLLLRPDGTVKIVDFGIARATETTRMTLAGTVLGTAAYLAPEQAAGEEVTAATDLYGLGAVLYELLTGRPPYDFSSLGELAQKQREGAITPIRDLVPDVPDTLEAVVMRCLARNPSFRPHSAADLARELAAASPEPPTQPLPHGTGLVATDVATTRLPARPRPQRPRRRIVPAVLALLIAAAVIAIGVAITSNGDDGTPTQPAPRSVQPVPPGATPEEDARNLSDWLRENSR
jgi:serine/threonine protein kinase